jgi:NHS family xanthosine MFS transporter
VGGTLLENLGLNAFALFKNYNMAVFFLFAMLLGAALQLTNAYGDTFLHDFANIEAHKNAFAVTHPAVILSISQISETLFILTIPFFLRNFGIKRVMFMSMIAWVLRFGLFAYGDPSGGLWMIVLSCIIYGMAFDFFNISGSLYVESQVTPGMRASGQGLFMMMSNGFGAFLGSRISGHVIDTYFMSEGKFDWHGIWLSFAGYAAVIAVLFLLLFRRPEEKAEDAEVDASDVSVAQA